MRAFTRLARPSMLYAPKKDTLWKLEDNETPMREGEPNPNPNYIE